MAESTCAAKEGCARPTIARGLCTKHYQREKAAEKALLAPPRRSKVDYFWSRVDRNCPAPAHQPHLGPCWEWGGTRDRDGYGLVKFDKRSQRTHRWVYEQLNGPLLAGLVVRHACDNPPCVNPSHLLKGTVAQNAADAVERGRLHRGDDHWVRKNPGSFQGAKNPAAKVTEDQVREIRAKYAVPWQVRPRQVDLAEAYGVDQVMISRIVNRKSWAHITD